MQWQKQNAEILQHYRSLIQIDCSNIIPSEAEATVDIRALPDENIPSFYEAMRRIIGDPAIVPSPASRLDTEMYRVLEQVSLRMYQGSTVMPSMSTGASDQAQLRAKGIQSGSHQVMVVGDSPRL